ncbi:MAG: hypothetical protein JWM32_109 [Verrucomicrobia bacterium]|nr:hypothetical protein [Verrucomicrobiota bacterium]
MRCPNALPETLRRSRPATGFAFRSGVVLLAAVSSHASSAPIDPQAPPRLCQNCAAALTGPYCAACGQHDVDYHRSFHHLFHDLLENLFHFEGKFFVTVAWLLAKPGRITQEFLAGRRLSQLNPLRFYIFVSVLFFLGISLLNHGHLLDVPRREMDDMQVDLTDRAKQFVDFTADFTPAEKKELARRITDAAVKTHGEVDRVALIESIRRERTPAAKPPVAGANKSRPSMHINNGSLIGRNIVEKLNSGELKLSEVLGALEHRVPSLLFLGVPLFAFLLKLSYLRSGRFYIEHLIFSLHLHTWFFLVLMVGNGYLKLAALGPSWLDSLAFCLLALWVAWYLFRSFRVVYGQGRLKTAAKMAMLMLAHSVALFVVAMILFVGTVAWLVLE